MRHGSIMTPRPDALGSLHARLIGGSGHASGPINWLASVPPDGDPLGNDVWGCCDPAADFRLIQLWGGHATRDLVLTRYEQLTGFREDNPLTDQGTDTNMDMRSWCAFPIYDGSRVWPVYWAQVDPHDMDKVMAALHRFPLLATLLLPVNIADNPELWSGQPAGHWPTDAHRVVLGGWDGQDWLVRTWGQDVKVSMAMMWTMLSPGVIDVAIPHPQDAPPEFDLGGIDFDTLEADLAALGLGAPETS